MSYVSLSLKIPENQTTGTLRERKEGRNGLGGDHLARQEDRANVIYSGEILPTPVHLGRPCAGWQTRGA